MLDYQKILLVGYNEIKLDNLRVNRSPPKIISNAITFYQLACYCYETLGERYFQLFKVYDNDSKITILFDKYI